MLRRLLPRTLQGRAVLIIVAPVALLLAVTTTIFYERHWDTVTRRLALGVAGEVALIVENMEALRAADTLDPFLASVRRELLLQVGFAPGAAVATDRQPISIQNRILDAQLAQALRERLEQPTRFDTATLPEFVEIHVQLADGVLTAMVPRDRLTSSSTLVFILWMVGASLILVGISLLFLRNQIRPIHALGAAADDFGKGRDVADLKPAGAIEIRRAAQAFNTMRSRILRFVAQRIEMLAGVSHDLRTPLTRMRLQLALLPPGDEADALTEDLDQMQAMIEGYLAFARNQDAEVAVETDLRALLERVVAAARRQGAEIALFTDGGLTVPLHSNAFQRCIANLVDNAHRYAEHVNVIARRVDGLIEVAVDDDGPGIPEAQREEVFRPFRRLDVSRNPETGGVGLGLAIARDVARSHGGEISLTRAPIGGLRALLRLPV